MSSDATNLDSLRVVDLKDMLKSHNLPVSGNKKDLIQRLKDNNVTQNAEQPIQQENQTIQKEDSLDQELGNIIDSNNNQQQQPDVASPQATGVVSPKMNSSENTGKTLKLKFKKSNLSKKDDIPIPNQNQEQSAHQGVPVLAQEQAGLQNKIIEPEIDQMQLQDIQGQQVRPLGFQETNMSSRRQSSLEKEIELKKQYSEFKTPTDQEDNNDIDQFKPETKLYGQDQPEFITQTPNPVMDDSGMLEEDQETLEADRSQIQQQTAQRLGDTAIRRDRISEGQDKVLEDAQQDLEQNFKLQGDQEELSGDQIKDLQDFARIPEDWELVKQDSKMAQYNQGQTQMDFEQQEQALVQPQLAKVPGDKLDEIEQEQREEIEAPIIQADDIGADTNMLEFEDGNIEESLQNLSKEPTPELQQKQIQENLQKHSKLTAQKQPESPIKRKYDSLNLDTQMKSQELKRNRSDQQDDRRSAPKLEKGLSKALKINNLVRPFKVKQVCYISIKSYGINELKDQSHNNLLNIFKVQKLTSVEELLKEYSDGKLQAFWLPTIKNYCLCVFENQITCDNVRQALYDLDWPQGNGGKLHPLFVPYEQAILQMQNTGSKELEEENIKIIQSLKPQQEQLQQDENGTQIKEKSRNLDEPNRQGKQIEAGNKQQKQKPQQQEEQSIDDIFKKTVARPPIYYLPLTKQQVEQKKQKLLEESILKEKTQVPKDKHMKVLDNEQLDGENLKEDTKIEKQRQDSTRKSKQLDDKYLDRDTIQRRPVNEGSRKRRDYYS